MNDKIHSFRTKLLVSFLICSLVPLLLCSVLLVRITSSRLNRKNEEDLALQMTSISQSMDTISSGLHHSCESLMENSSVRIALSGGSVTDTVINSSLFKATEDLRGYASIGIYDLNGCLLYSTKADSANSSLPVTWGILHSAAGSTDPVFQISTGSSSGLLQGAAVLKTGDGQPLGYLILEMDHNDFFDLFNGRYTPSDDILVVNSFWRPVYSSSSDLWTNVAPQLREQQLKGEPIHRSGMTYGISYHAPTGLYLILQKPQAFNQETTRMMYIISLTCAFLCVAVAICIYLPMSKQISAPIQQMRTGFQRLEQDDLEVQLPTDRKDELGQLSNAFNHTVRALKQNREDLLLNQKELNDAQIRLLQTQLNPHFLCNTLDTMKWISKINHVPEVAEMSASLADILRYCITSEEFVPLYREIEFLQRYIDIQKIRMGDKFRYETDVPDELSTCIVPKMILQPIVENAVLHGLSETEESRILLAVRLIGRDLKITISDNGCGLPEEMIGKPYTEKPDIHGHHLGLYNVNTILTKYYGAEYGLFLDRGPDNIGTTVTATLPADFGGNTHDESPDRRR